MLGAFRASLPTGNDLYFITGFASAGGLLWFNCLAIAVHILGSKINRRVIIWLNRICGAVIILYGVKLLVNSVQMQLPKFCGRRILNKKENRNYACLMNQAVK